MRHGARPLVVWHVQLRKCLDGLVARKASLGESPTRTPTR
jgi:hypothetical protein